MKQFKVIWARTETRVWEYEVVATDEDHARRIAQQLADNEPSEGKAVWAEEECNEITEIQGETNEL